MDQANSVRTPQDLETFKYDWDKSYWNFPRGSSQFREVSRKVALSIVNAAAKNAARKARVRVASQGTENSASRALPPWQSQLLQGFRTTWQARYYWKDLAFLRDIAAKEAAAKARQRLRRRLQEIETGGMPREYIKHALQKNWKELLTLLRQFIQFLHLLVHSKLAQRHVIAFQPGNLLRNLVATLESGRKDLDELRNLLAQRDRYIIGLRTSQLADRVLVRYGLVRPLAFAENLAARDAMAKGTVEGLAHHETISALIRKTLRRDRDEQTVIQKQARVFEERKYRLSGASAYYPHTYQAPRKVTHLSGPRASPATYAAHKITTRVILGNDWRTATIDLSRDSVIDARLFDKADMQPPANRGSFNMALLEDEPEEQRAKIQILLKLTGKFLEITPTVAIENQPDPKIPPRIVLGRDLFFQEQVVPHGDVLHYLDMPRGKTATKARFLDGSMVVVDMELPEKPAEEGEPIYYDQTRVWWDYWETRAEVKSPFS